VWEEVREGNGGEQLGEECNDIGAEAGINGYQVIQGQGEGHGQVGDERGGEEQGGREGAAGVGQAVVGASAIAPPAATCPTLHNTAGGSTQDTGGGARSRVSSGQLPSVAECCICLGPIRQRTRVAAACGHEFCFGCISKEVDHRGCCPLDRLPLTRAQLIRLDRQPTAGKQARASQQPTEAGGGEAKRRRVVSATQAD
jgi:hypothetical protein